MEVSKFLSYWGAILSSILGIYQIYKIYRDRLHVQASFEYGDLDMDDIIVIDNPSPVSIVIKSYKLFWVTKRFFKKPIQKEVYLDHLEFIGRRDTLNGYSHMSISLPYEICGEIKRPNNKAKLILNLYIVGRSRPLTKQIL